MPSREPTRFGPAAQTAMQKRRSQCDDANTWRANADPGGIEERTGPARIFGMPVEDERVRREIAQLHGGGGEQLVERDRKRASLRQEQCLVPLSPVLDQRDVRVRRRGRFHPPTSTAKPPVSAAISRACASSRGSPIAAPPPPAPVSFAPSAPAFRSAATVSSSSVQETPSSRSPVWASSNVAPSPRRSPRSNSWRPFLASSPRRASSGSMRASPLR